MEVKQRIYFCSVAEFLDECMMGGVPGAWISHAQVHRAFCKWLQTQDEYPRRSASNTLGYVIGHTKYLAAYRHRREIDGHRIYGWKGLWPRQPWADRLFEVWWCDERDGRYRYSPGQCVKSLSGG